MEKTVLLEIIVWLEKLEKLVLLVKTVLLEILEKPVLLKQKFFCWKKLFC